MLVLNSGLDTLVGGIVNGLGSGSQEDHLSAWLTENEPALVSSNVEDPVVEWNPEPAVLGESHPSTELGVVLVLGVKLDVGILVSSLGLASEPGIDSVLLGVPGEALHGALAVLPALLLIADGVPVSLEVLGWVDEGWGGLQAAVEEAWEVAPWLLVWVDAEGEGAAGEDSD